MILEATVWRKIQLTATDQANVNTVAGQISPTNNIGTVAGLNTEITNLAGLSSYKLLQHISGLNIQLEYLRSSNLILMLSGSNSGYKYTCWII